jgi:hypothetical protein
MIAPGSCNRFQPVPTEQHGMLDLWLPANLTSVAALAESGDSSLPAVSTPAGYSGGPIEFDRVVPASGTMTVCQRQFWMGTARAGMVARVWAECDLIHVLIAGIRIKTIRSHLGVTDLAALVAQGAVPAGPGSGLNRPP